MELNKKRCVPCEAGTSPLSKIQSENYLRIVKGWTIKNMKLYKEFKFKNFKKTLKFVNKVGEIAEIRLNRLQGKTKPPSKKTLKLMEGKK